MKKDKKSYRQVEHEDIITVWVCNNKGCEDYCMEAEIMPDDLNDEGIPMCSKCGEEMSWKHTNVF